ncbi:MAG: OprD family outer membrane porin [Sulfurospirillum sp.]
MELKNLGLSVLAVAAFTTNVYSADSLKDAFSNGKFDGGFKAVVYDVDKAAKGKESITSLGVMLHYTTAPFYGFSIGLRAQSSNSPWTNDKEKKFYKADLYGPGAVLEEAYLKYQIKKSSIKVGRQFIKTPLLSGSGSRIIHESFEGYTADIKALPKTSIFAGYVNKYLTRTNFLTSTDQGVGTFAKNIFMYGAKYKYKMDNLWTVMINNKSVKGLNLTGQYLVVKNATIASTNTPQGDITVGLAQAEYKFKAGGLGMLAGIQYGSSNVDKDPTRSGDLVGFKLATKYNGLMAGLGYTIANKDKSMVSGVGISSNWAYAGDKIGLENYNKDVDALSLNLKYKFKKFGMKNLMMLGRYTRYNMGSNATLNGGKDLNAYDFVARYAFLGSLKGLAVKVHYENVTYDTGDVTNYRLYADYKF